MGKSYRKHQKGFSLVEVLVASSILATVVAGSMAVQTSLMGNVRNSNDNAFASEKALQMFEELRSHTEGSQESFDKSLAKYSDGASYNPNLSTALTIATPDDPLSNNIYYDGHWKYVRQVSIEPVENDEFARKVRVSVWRGDEDGKPLVNRPLATVAGILKTSVPRTPPTQLYDFYVIAIANTPSWWSDLYDFKPSYDAVFNDLEFRNPGLKLRKRFISNFGFGRDPFYLPHTNTENVTESSATRLPWTYYYPGKVLVKNGGNVGKVKEDYAFDYITSRIRGDVSDKIFHISERNDVNQYRPYAMADEFNHVLRIPAQRAMETRLREYANQSISTSATLANPQLRALKDALTQPSLVTFLEDMYQGRYRNSMVSNMHAELTPIVPYRNYADPAKMPVDQRDADDNRNQNKRVVTHSEKIFYDNNENLIRFRVYPFEMPSFGRTLDYRPGGGMYSTEEILTKKIEHVSVFLPMDGKGRHPVNSSQSGYLSNPDYTPTLDQARQAIAPVKIIGNSRAQYRYRRHASLYGRAQNDLTCMYCDSTSVADAQRDYTLLTTQDVFLTGTNTIPPNNSILPAAVVDANSQTQPLGRLYAISNDRTRLVFERYSPADDAADLNTLVGDSIVVNAEQPYNSGATDGFSTSDIPANREIRQILNVEQPSRLQNLGMNFGGVTNTEEYNLRYPVVVTLDRPLDNNHATNQSLISLPFLSADPSDGELVTRHKDYSLSVNPTVYGQQRDGININLFNTPTRHPSGPGNTGLSANRRLFETEYIPAPVNLGSVTTANDIRDDFKTDLTDARANNDVFPNPQRNESSSSAQERAKNTARWVIEFQPDQVSTTALEKTSSGVFHLTAETRIVGGQNENSPQFALQSPDVSAYLQDGLSGDGDPYQPNQGAGEHLNRLRLNPYNVSRTYLYRGTDFADDVPRFEQMQYIGDPRHMPYADVKARDGYNTASFCMTNDKECISSQSGFSNQYNTQMGGYDGYDAHTGKYSNVSKIDVDVSKAFSMYIDGIMKSNSVYNTIAGYTNYIISLGGGVGQRGNHTYEYDMKRAPWDTSSSTANNNISNGEGQTLVSERGSGGSLRFVTANNGNLNERWSGFYYLGDLFPDEMFEFWLENGNLPNITFQNSDRNPDIASPVGLPSTINGVAPRFYRAPYYDTRYDLGRRERITAEGAVSDFYNGSSDPGNNDNRIKHSTTSGIGCLQAGSQAAGRYLSDAFNMSLPESISSTRSFCASSGTCYQANGTNSSAYTATENKIRRNTIKYVNLTGPNKGDLVDNLSEYNAFYRFHTGSSCGSGGKDNAASALIRISRDAIGSQVAADSTMIGYAVINGLDQGSTFGAQSLSRLAQSATLQAYLEGGDKQAPGDDDGRVVPLPRVELIEPNPNLIYSTNSVNVKFKVDWLRWDEKPYSPSYPPGWYDETPIQFNAMYSPDNGRTWKYVNSGASVSLDQMGFYNPSEPLFSPNTFTMSDASDTWNFSWNISGLDDAAYPLRIYAFREGFDIGASYHEILVTRKK